MIEVVVAALQQDEDLGKNALESFVDLSQGVPTFFKESAAAIVKVVSDAARNDEFEEGTKSQACEIVLNLTEAMPAIMRKVNEVKTEFWPALMQMLARAEADMEVWEASLDDELGTKSDAYSTAVSSIGRLSGQLKEKNTVAASTPLIGECLNHGDWTAKQAGFITIGLIVEPCKDHFKANMDAAMTQVCAGLQTDHTRVKYARLYALGTLLQHLAPNVQFKYHAELMPALLSIVTSEPSLKVKTMAFYCLAEFMQGLIREDELEIESTKKQSEIVEEYNDALFKALIESLKQSVDAGYEALQEQVMQLLNVAASLIESKFAAYFDQFMPLMVTILTGVKGETTGQRGLRARTIESIGIMIAAVAEEQRFKPTVQEVTEKLFAMLTAGGFDASDP
jgi:urease gamma subunit